MKHRSAALLAGLLLAACSPGDNEVHKTMEDPTRPITAVVADHTQEFLALEGVVGLLATEDASGRPCIKVLLARDTPGLRARIPAELEGYPVFIEETGEFRPRGSEN